MARENSCVKKILFVCTTPASWDNRCKYYETSGEDGIKCKYQIPFDHDNIQPETSLCATTCINYNAVDEAINVYAEKVKREARNNGLL